MHSNIPWLGLCRMLDSRVASLEMWLNFGTGRLCEQKDSLRGKQKGSFVGE